MALTFDSKKNFSYSVIATAPSPATSGTSLNVAPSDGTKFPTPPFNAVVWPPDVQPTSDNAEVIRVTAIVGDVFTITRAQEGSTARSIALNDQIAVNITAKSLTDIETGITTGVNAGIPVGVILGWAAASAPTGWLLCDGSNVSRTTYSALFSIIGTTFGAGDGSTTFGLPNLKGRIIIGVDASNVDIDTIGETQGSWDHTHDSGTLAVASHTHGPGTLQVASHSHDSGTLAVASHFHGAGTYVTDSKNLAHTHTFSDTATTGAASASDNASQSSPDVSVARGTHTHSVTVSGTTGGMSANTSHSHDVSGSSSSSAPSVSSGNTGFTAPLVNAGVSAATAPAVSSGVTGAANPPVMALNYIIRALDTV